MNQTDTTGETTEPATSHSVPATRLRRHWLILARSACIGVMILFLGLFVAALPIYFVRLNTVCSPPFCSIGQLSPTALHTLRTLGLSLHDYIVFILPLILISTLASVSIATILLWRTSDNGMAMLVALLLTLQGTGVIIGDRLLLGPLLGQTLASAFTNCSNFVIVLCTILVFCLFPNGRFVPRWTLWFMLFVVVLDVFFSFIATLFVSPPSTQVPTWLDLLSSVLWLGFLISVAGAQIYRYRRVSTPVERQQTKWVVFSFALALLQLLLVAILPTLIFPPLGQPDSLYYIVSTLVSGNLIIELLLAFSFGIAILRYRLYDIDVLINRTLVYGILTAALALIYVSLIFALQSLTHALTGQVGDNPLLIVGSTLVIAALFNPLRRRIQTLIDRRFYRRKYDAARTLAAFSATLRNEMDLERLSEELVAVVNETMQPSYISLWLRTSASSRKRTPTRVSDPPAS